ncbi:MAG TPA: hypothetical protein VJ783_28980 [Pirellulales bacterium]|nr:hypothetical protein [Pirellulales bacterium]
MAGVFRTGVMLGVLVMLAMFAARMPVSVMFATSLAVTLAVMGVAVVFMAVMSVAVVFMAAMRIAVVAARMMLAVAMLAMTACMLPISIAVAPGISVPFAATFMTTLALAATAALAAIIVIVVCVLFFVAALAVVIAEGEQMHIDISLLGLDRHACLGRRHFACQGPQHGQSEVTQNVGRAQNRPRLDWMGRQTGGLRFEA